LNLALNARDAMPGGGTLTVTTQYVELDAASPAVQAGEVVAGPYVWLTVADTGHGMAPEVLARVCEPFFTTKPRDHGTGLGLAMVYGFVKQSNGHLRIDSAPGQGTRVHLYLPVAERTTSPVPVTRGSRVAARGRGTVLVVEDEVDLLEVAVAYLKEMGFTVLSARDGPAALEVVARTPELDLVVTDVVMPGGLHGVALAHQIRQQRPAVTVLYTSGFPASALAARRQLQLDGLLVNKPYQKEHLQAAIHQALARRQGPGTATDGEGHGSLDEARDAMGLRVPAGDHAHEPGLTDHPPAPS
jgi:CheY-like chemotaxis protein